jgi:CRP-like cAMP-binding protein
LSDEVDREQVIERQIFIRSLNIARPTGSAAQQLARAMRDQLFPAGEVLYSRGEAASRIYYIMRGDIELSLEGAEPWTMKAPSVVGILDVLQDRPRERTARALTDVKALVLSGDDYFDVLEDNFEFARAALCGVASNLHMMSLGLAPTGGFPDPAGPILAPPDRPLSLVERTLTLYDAPAFRAASVQGVSRLAGLAEEVRYAEGDAISRFGEPCASLVVVACGLVQIRREDPRLEARFGAGSIVGGYASIGRDAHQYDSTALAPTVALRVRKDDFFDLLEDHSEVTRSVLAFMAIERERILDERAVRVKAGEDLPAPSTLGAANLKA